MQTLASSSLSGATVLGACVLLLVMYLIHELYWINRSIKFMIAGNTKNISELDIEVGVEIAK